MELRDAIAAGITHSVIQEGEKWDKMKAHMKKYGGKYAAGAAGLGAAGLGAYAYKNPGSVAAAKGFATKKFNQAKGRFTSEDPVKKTGKNAGALGSKIKKFFTTIPSNQSGASTS